MKNRIISACVMLLIFVPILLLGNIYYTVLGSVLGIISLWEIMNLEKNIPNYMKMITYFVSLYLILYNYKILNFDSIYSFTSIISIIFIYLFSVIINNNIKKYTYKEALWLLSIAFFIGVFFNCFIKVRLLGIYPVLYCFIIAVATDTFAYLGGSLFGKHKLSMEISPNKTIEGSVIGSLFGTIIGIVFYYFVIGNINIYYLVILSFLLTIFAQLGDLFFSSIKRFYGIKDYSNIIPGHGGILDRLDSVLFVILGFLLYISII